MIELDGDVEDALDEDVAELDVDVGGELCRGVAVGARST